jgi:hypothetical protein
MIGRPEIPKSFEGDRFTISVPAHPWRDMWDRDDNALSTVLAAAASQVSVPPVDVLSFRSNRCEISILNEYNFWFIAWDERFFDYIVFQLLALAAEDAAVIENLTYGTLFRYAGERQLTDNPHLALALTTIGYSYYGGEAQSSDSNEEAVEALLIIYRIMRTFILFHELGHIGVRNREFYVGEMRKFKSAVELYKCILADREKRKQGRRL